MKSIDCHFLLENYRGFLLDAYGVLVHSEGVLPGASDFVDRLRRENRPFRIISNDASTTPEAKVSKWQSLGLNLEPDELITPWHVLASELSPVSLKDKGCLVLGTPRSAEMARRAGGRLVESPEGIDVFLLADEMSENLLEVCDRYLSVLVEAFRSGRNPSLVLVNPDLVYPSAQGYGFTSGCLSLMFEAGLGRLLNRDFKFLAIGKPRPELYELGRRELSIRKVEVAMLGDQIDTDVRGARAAGITPVLLGSGVTSAEDAERLLEPEDLFLPSLAHLG